MNSPRYYWAERLTNGRVFTSNAYAEGGLTHRGRWPWPAWVSRKALWDDYLLWFNDGFCQDHKVDDPGSVTDFFRAMKPYLYPEGANSTATSFEVRLFKRADKHWVPVTVRRKFIRMPDLEEARMRFKIVNAALDIGAADAYIL